MCNISGPLGIWTCNIALVSASHLLSTLVFLHLLLCWIFTCSTDTRNAPPGFALEDSNIANIKLIEGNGFRASWSIGIFFSFYFDFANFVQSDFLLYLYNSELNKKKYSTCSLNSLIAILFLMLVSLCLRLMTPQTGLGLQSLVPLFGEWNSSMSTSDSPRYWLC